MSLKIRLNLLITALLLLTLLLGMGLLIINARQQVLAEVESTATVIEHMMGKEVMASLPLDKGAATLSQSVQGLAYLRHMRAEIYDINGQLLDSNHAHAAAHGEPPAPAWFNYLMTVAVPPHPPFKRPIEDRNQQVGWLIVAADPSYEVEEVWHDTTALFALFLLFFVAVNVLVYWTVGKAIQPAEHIHKALDELEHGNWDARLPQFHLPELDRISQKFNAMAQTLQRTLEHNRKLTGQLITVQEAERKSLARDLHDEMGQYLTAINVDAAAIASISQDVPAVRHSAEAIMHMSQSVMRMIGAMLQQLRPDALDHLGLYAALNELITNWRQRNPGISCILKLDSTIDPGDDNIKITAFRIVQECLTNIARHAKAHHVEIHIASIADRSGKQLRVKVIDDGIGLGPQHFDGFGISGMRERVNNNQVRFIAPNKAGYA